MENKKILSIIYSCKDEVKEPTMLKVAGFSEDTMEILCVDENRSMEDLAQAVSKAKGNYVTFVREFDSLQKDYFKTIVNSLNTGYKIYSTTVQKEKGERNFFLKMYEDEVFDYIDVTEEYLKILSGFLGTVINREALHLYIQDAKNNFEESLIVTKLVTEEKKYGWIPTKLLYRDKGSDFVVRRNKGNIPEDYEMVVSSYYEKLLEMKSGLDQELWPYIDALLTADIYFRVNGGKKVDTVITKKYLEEITPVTEQIADEIFSSEKINFISANKRTYLTLKYKFKGEEPKYVYNTRGIIFYGKDVVLRRMNSVPAQLYKVQMEDNYLCLEGKIDFNLSLKTFNLVVSRKELQADLRTHLCETTELENVGEKIFGDNITKTLIFKGRIRITGKMQIIQLSFKIGSTMIPLNIKTVKNSQAERYFSCKKEYDKYILEKTEKKYLTFVENTKENLDAQVKMQYAYWKYVYGKDKIETVEANIKKYKRLAPVFSRNRNLLVTCKEDISPELKARLKQKKDVKVRVCSIAGKEIDGFINIKYGSRKHRFAYIFDRYELSLLDNESKYSAFGRDRQFYEGIRRAKVYELK